MRFEEKFTYLIGCAVNVINKFLVFSLFHVEFQPYLSSLGMQCYDCSFCRLMLHAGIYISGVSKAVHLLLGISVLRILQSGSIPMTGFCLDLQIASSEL